jgi:hypothetical protein
MFPEQAGQFNIRTTTVAGLGDLTFTIYNIIAEGFF